MLALWGARMNLFRSSALLLPTRPSLKHFRLKWKRVSGKFRFWSVRSLNCASFTCAKTVHERKSLVLQFWPTNERRSTSGEDPVSYTHLRAHETVLDLVCRL